MTESTPPLTPEERAEFVAKHFDGPLPVLPNTLRIMIADQIRQAVEETEHNMNHTSRSVHSCELGMKQAREKGFAEGIERAAKTIDKYECHADCDCAKKIRALRTGGEKKEKKP